ncbi:LytTR family DNA-binding domain-containing protein [Novosphingobium sp.]|uniref:LytR/AlgR family response regulator transcription factor n=1 Tax=Novosphingobium sp. TaxID=1874826 RepID=UPI0027364149|nr:LytTR family DNA-binding domain-containing protein [Novosphingobium sp.]MDP3907523.1 LytTR family DNA-binding domain-containing protein [Novosphingobium sp.]
MLNVLIVDDEPLAHEVLAHHCRGEPDIAIAAHCLSAAEALARLEAQCIDLMFLDIRMPLFGGLDLLRGLHSPPLTIIVSAHQEHALAGFELDVVDYLLKPVSAERFQKALGKVRRRIAERPIPRPANPEDIVLKVDRVMRRFRLAEVSAFEAQGNFVNVVGDWGTALATATLKGLRTGLPPERFVQVHRSFIVNRDRIVEQHHDKVRLEDGRLFPIGRSYRAADLLRPPASENREDRATMPDVCQRLP